MTFRIGLNPYGLAYTVGLQAMGTARANPRPLGLDGFVAIARERGASCIELDWRWLTALADADLVRLRESLAGVVVVYSHWLSQEPGETLRDPVSRASALGAAILRIHLTPVLEGARAAWGARWNAMLAHARSTLLAESSRVADAGLTLAIENHQDLGSEELVELAEALGAHAGIVMDTGNPYAVGEDPVAFARRAAHRIRHVHLKDYRAQFTDEGYRLVRCAIGDGAVPFPEIAGALSGQGRPLTASIEPGALEARHIRLFQPQWWEGYSPRQASEIGTMLGRLRKTRLSDDEDGRTPWELEQSADHVMAFERAQLDRSYENLRGLGWLPDS